MLPIHRTATTIKKAAPTPVRPRAIKRRDEAARLPDGPTWGLRDRDRPSGASRILSTASTARAIATTDIRRVIEGDS